MKIPKQAPESGLASMSTASFGLVMATGIVSVPASLLALPLVDAGLFKLNIVFFVSLWALNLCRLVSHPRRFLGDIADHLRAPGYYAMVAGSGILGTQFSTLLSNHIAGWWR